MVSVESATRRDSKGVTRYQRSKTQRPHSRPRGHAASTGNWYFSACDEPARIQPFGLVASSASSKSLMRSSGASMPTESISLPLSVDSERRSRRRIRDPTTSVRPDDNKTGPEYLAPRIEVRLEGFEPPTLGSVGTFHSHQLRISLENIVRFTISMFTQVHGCSTR